MLNEHEGRPQMPERTRGASIAPARLGAASQWVVVRIAPSAERWMPMSNTAIEWTDATWNPVRGCRRVSPGCESCYAERQAYRFSGPGMPYEGLVRLGKQGPTWTGDAKLFDHMLAAPLKWKKPRRVFVNSMSDLFHESLSNEDIAAVFGVMAACPQHTFQVLTKRAERMREWFLWANSYGPPPAAGAISRCEEQAELRGALPSGTHRSRRLLDERDQHGFRIFQPWPLPNVHLGVSVEDQRRADERIPNLLTTPAAVRWISAEPLLEELDLFAFLGTELRNAALRALGSSPMPGLDWIVVGGESGPDARACSLDWLRGVVDQCRAADVPAFVKQLGGKPFHAAKHDGGTSYFLPIKNRAGGDMAEWPEQLRVRMWPGEKWPLCPCSTDVEEPGPHIAGCEYLARVAAGLQEMPF